MHRVPVARDGSFRVAVSTDTSAAILKLYGTYVYLRSNKAWKRDSDQPILLKPELGAAIDLYVAVPSQWALPPKGWTCNLTTPGSYMGSRQPGLVDGRRIEARGIAVDEYFLVNAWADGLAAQSYRAQELTPGEKRDVTLTFLPGHASWAPCSTSKADRFRRARYWCAAWTKPIPTRSSTKPVDPKSTRVPLRYATCRRGIST